MNQVWDRYSIFRCERIVLLSAGGRHQQKDKDLRKGYRSTLRFVSYHQYHVRSQNVRILLRSHATEPRTATHVRPSSNLLKTPYVLRMQHKFSYDCCAHSNESSQENRIAPPHNTTTTWRNSTDAAKIIDESAVVLFVVDFWCLGESPKVSDLCLGVVRVLWIPSNKSSPWATNFCKASLVEDCERRGQFWNKKVVSK